MPHHIRDRHTEESDPRARLRLLVIDYGEDPADVEGMTDTEVWECLALLDGLAAGHSDQPTRAWVGQ